MIKAKPLSSRFNLTKGLTYEFKKLSEGYITTNDKGTEEYFFIDYFKELFEIVEDSDDEISNVKNENIKWILPNDELNEKLKDELKYLPDDKDIYRGTRIESGANDGSANAFYKIPDWVKDCDLLAEYLELDHYEANILKTLWINKGARHDGTNKNRELNKRLHYAQKSIEKLNRLEK